ncbi:ATP-dependent DNA helicase [Trichonephila clavipes]|nr:ATP-dependent DNA helicase [Trichonephila clavipes]
MFAKIESERLRYIQCNQKELKVEEYIHLRDAVVSEGGLTHTSHYSQEYFVPIKSIKYVCKYSNKGSDIAVFDVTSSDGNTCNEVYQYEIGRHISSNEAVWSILNFPIHECYPTVIHLIVHLENGQRVHFTEGNAAERARFAPETTFIAYFNICNVDDFARTLFYHQIPSNYKEACQVRGLLENEEHWNATLEKVAFVHSPQMLRDLCRHAAKRQEPTAPHGWSSQIPPKKSRRKPISDLNKALTGGALSTSQKKKSSPGHLSRCFLTADSHWLGTRACPVPVISLRRCQSMFWVFHCNQFLTLKLGEWGATSVVLLVTQLEFRMTRSVCA